MSRFFTRTALVLAAASQVLAQTSTSCNPLNTTCPPDPALGTTFSTTFNTSMSEMDPRFFNVTAGASLISFSDDGADFTINQQGDSVTVKTAFYIMFGRAEMIFRAAKGQGIISTMIGLSDDLDEIDWEIRGGITQNVTNNWYGHGNQTQINNEDPDTTMWDGGAMGGFHNFTFDWNQDRIDYVMDGNVVRTVPYNEPGLYPQSPCYISFGIWAGGDPDNKPGVREWAGGDTDYSQAPFTMTVQSLKVVDANTNVSWYTYGDQTGSWESIKMETGESNAYKYIHQKTASQKLQQQWQGLSTGAKIGIACGVVGLFAICLVAFAFYCIKQRRAGKAEKAAADQQWDGQQAELMEYRDRMKRGDFAIHHMGHGEKF